MYVCICNGYTDKDIRKVVGRGGVNTARQAYAALGRGFCCGKCRDCANKVVGEALSDITTGVPDLLAAE